MLQGINRLVRYSQRLSRPVFDPITVTRRLIRGIPLYVGYFRDLLEYKKLDGSSSIKLRDLAPYIHNKTATHKIDPHYFYQSAWAFRLIHQSEIEHHVDVGSEDKFVGMLSAIVEVTFIDIRPLEAELDNFHSKPGNILSLPYPDRSVESLSCLHVIEHIGLGRYGDQIDPEGTFKAARELVRILGPGGNLYLSLPIGQQRVCFNAQRIHSTSAVMEMFEGLDLVEFSSVSDGGKFMRFSDVDGFEEARYSCGLFRFRAPRK